MINSNETIKKTHHQYNNTNEHVKIDPMEAKETRTVMSLWGKVKSMVHNKRVIL